MKVIHLAHACITSIRSRNDKSASFSVVTPEMTVEQCAELLRYHGINARILIEPLEETPDERVEVKSELKQKTQGQRIRACCFKIWQTHGSKGDFEYYYRMKTERIISWLKQQIEE